MNKTKNNLSYPENAYYALFQRTSDVPADAAESLEYVTETLFEQEAEIFMLRYRYEMTYEEIGEKYGYTRERIRQIIRKTERKLRHPSRCKFLLRGREEHLSSIVAVNEEKKRQYQKRIAELEDIIREQGQEIDRYLERLIGLSSNIQPTYDILCSSIDVLNLSTRSRNCLTRADVKTIKDLIDYEDLTDIRNMGALSAREVQDKLKAFIERHGLKAADG